VASYVRNIYGDKAFTFKVEAKRGDKQYPMKSPEICMELGGYLLEQFPNIKVDVHNPEVRINVEIRNKAYVYSTVIQGAGGMPVGTNGKAMLLLSGGIDSPVAGYRMARRGIKLDALHFESYPYTSLQAREKVVELAQIMTDYCGDINLNIVSVTHIQEELRSKCKEDYFTLLLRRFMMKIAERVAIKYHCGAIITGESTGQVASQTIPAMTVTNEAVKLIPVMRPLIASDKEEIVKYARHIGTFETSILPYEDCCTVFTPKHPATKPVLEKIIEEEKKLDCEALIEEALKTIDYIKVERK
jgi:thiamine biosynthesis protein ThiI